MLTLIAYYWLWWKQLWCIHDYHLKADAHPTDRAEGQTLTGRIFQQCVKCNNERPGWTIDLQRNFRLNRRRRTAEQDRKIADFRMRRRG